MAHTYTTILVHAVFSTSGRAPFLNSTIRPEMHAYLGGILRELGAVPIVIGGTADHVHLLIGLPANISVADCLRVVKTNSSRWAKGDGIDPLPGRADMERSASANRGVTP